VCELAFGEIRRGRVREVGGEDEDDGAVPAALGGRIRTGAMKGREEEEGGSAGVRGGGQGASHARGPPLGQEAGRRPGGVCWFSARVKYL
jgi:hypothetical protein